MVETDASGNITAEYIFFNGKRVAMRKPDNSVHYYFADQAGSATTVTSATGTTEQEIEYHPYGEQVIITDTLGQEYRFTGKEHDEESGNDYFVARYYSSVFGRFMTPDWAATPVPIPYAQMGNPQTLNLYSYVENDPITGTDPDGHAGECNGPGGVSCTGAHETRQDAAANQSSTAMQFFSGVSRGFWSSLTFGAIGGPQPGDTAASRIGQAIGSAGEGMLGNLVANGGAAATGGGLVLAPASGGTSLGGTAVGVTAIAAGGAMEIGAVANLTKIITTPVQSSGTTSSGTSAKPTLSEHKAALKKVQRIVGKQAKAVPGKFGSPQRGTPRSGYRLDPGHPNAQNPAEAGPHINYWDYTTGKRGSGGVSGAVPIPPKD